MTQRFTKATTLFYRYAYRRVSVSDLKITPFLIPQLSQPVRVGIASINLVQDRRDDPVDPHKGIYNTVDLGWRRARLRVAAQLSCASWRATPATTRSASGWCWRAARSSATSTRSTITGDPLEAIPLPERFFGGGGTSHRGFPENQAGPRDTSTGFPLGGTALLFNQTELRFPLIGENIGGVLFHDMGNIYSSLTRSFRSACTTSATCRISITWCTRSASESATARRSARCASTSAIASIRRSSSASRAPSRTWSMPGPTPCPAPGGAPYQCVRQNAGHFRYFFSDRTNLLRRPMHYLAVLLSPAGDRAERRSSTASPCRSARASSRRATSTARSASRHFWTGSSRI